MRRKIFHSSFSHKIISLITALSFILTTCNLSLAVQTLPEDSDHFRSNEQPTQTELPVATPKPLLDVNMLEIPRNLGQVVDRYKGESNKTIIYVQDLHAHYEGQLKLAGILEDLIQNHGINVILVEGGITDKDFSYLRHNFSQETRQEKAEKLLKEGVINGEEYLDIARDYDLKFQGIEDKELYEKNMEAFLKVEAFCPDANQFVKLVKGAVNDLKPSVYNKALKELDSFRHDFASDKIDIPKYADYLNTLSCKVGLPTANSRPNFSQLCSLIEEEGRLDFGKVEEERNAFILKLKASLSEKEVEELLKMAMDFKNGKIDAVKFHRQLANLSNYTVDVDIKNFGTLKNYIEYLNSYEKIDPVALFDEISNIENELQAKLCDNEEQKTLVRVSRNINFLENFLNLKLTPKDWDFYCQHKDEFVPEEWLSFITAAAKKYNISLQILEGSSSISDNLPIMETFYGTAMERDQAFLRNSLAKLEKENENSGILIGGGFHTPHLTELLKKNGISYVVISPKITEKSDEDRYHKSLKDAYSTRLWGSLNPQNMGQDQLRNVRGPERDLAMLYEGFGLLTFEDTIALMRKAGINEDKIKGLEKFLAEKAIPRTRCVAEVLEDEEIPFVIRKGIHDFALDEFIALAYSDDMPIPDRVKIIAEENASDPEVARTLKSFNEVMEFLKANGLHDVADVFEAMRDNGEIRLLIAEEIFGRGGRRLPFIGHASDTSIHLWDTVDDRAITLLHELGARLGLTHAGNNRLNEALNKWRESHAVVLTEESQRSLNTQAVRYSLRPFRIARVDLHQPQPRQKVGFTADALRRYIRLQKEIKNRFDPTKREEKIKVTLALQKLLCLIFAEINDGSIGKKARLLEARNFPIPESILEVDEEKLMLSIGGLMAAIDRQGGLGIIAAESDNIELLRGIILAAELGKEDRKMYSEVLENLVQLAKDNTLGGLLPGEPPRISRPPLDIRPLRHLHPPKKAATRETWFLELLKEAGLAEQEELIRELGEKMAVEVPEEDLRGAIPPDIKNPDARMITCPSITGFLIANGIHNDREMTALVIAAAQLSLREIPPAKTAPVLPQTAAEARAWPEILTKKAVFLSLLEETGLGSRREEIEALGRELGRELRGNGSEDELRRAMPPKVGSRDARLVIGPKVKDFFEGEDRRNLPADLITLTICAAQMNLPENLEAEFSYLLKKTRLTNRRRAIEEWGEELAERAPAGLVPEDQLQRAKPFDIRNPNPEDINLGDAIQSFLEEERGITPAGQMASLVVFAAQMELARRERNGEGSLARAGGEERRDLAQMAPAGQETQVRSIEELGALFAQEGRLVSQRNLIGALASLASPGIENIKGKKRLIRYISGNMPSELQAEFIKQTNDILHELGLGNAIRVSICNLETVKRESGPNEEVLYVIDRATYEEHRGEIKGRVLVVENTIDAATGAPSKVLPPEIVTLSLGLVCTDADDIEAARQGQENIATRTVRVYQGTTGRIDINLEHLAAIVKKDGSNIFKFLDMLIIRPVRISQTLTAGIKVIRNILSQL